MSNNWHEENKRYLLAKIKELNENLTSYLDNCNFYVPADNDQNLKNSSIKHNKNESGKIINKKQENNNETKSQPHG